MSDPVNANNRGAGDLLQNCYYLYPTKLNP